MTNKNADLRTLCEMLRDGYTSTEQIKECALATDSRIQKACDAQWLSERLETLADDALAADRWPTWRDGSEELHALLALSQEAGDAIKKLLHRLEEGMDCEDCRAGFCSTPASLR